MAGDAQAEKTVVISGVTFAYDSDWKIYVWRNGYIWRIEDAYILGYLMPEDIRKIGYYHEEFSANGGF